MGDPKHQLEARVSMLEVNFSNIKESLEEFKSDRKEKDEIVFKKLDNLSKYIWIAVGALGAFDLVLRIYGK